MEELKIRFSDKIELYYVFGNANHILSFEKDGNTYEIALGDEDKYVKVKIKDNDLIREFFSWIYKITKLGEAGKDDRD